MRAYGIQNLSELSRRLGYDRPERVRNIMTGSSLPSFGMIHDLAKTFGDLNIRWLISGEGPMMSTAIGQLQNISSALKPVQDAIRPLKELKELMDSIPKTGDLQIAPAIDAPSRIPGPGAIAADPEVPYGSKGQGNIVMLDTKVAAGLPANYGNSEYLRDQPRFSLPGHKYRGSGLIALQVEGDSMDPTVRHDDWIIAKLLTDPLQELREGYLYVLVTKDGCVAKRLYRTVTDAFLCKSDNEDYPPYEQAIGPGDQVYKALALFSENLGHRRDGLFDRLVSLEKAVLKLQTRSKSS